MSPRRRCSAALIACAAMLAAGPAPASTAASLDGVWAPTRPAHAPLKTADGAAPPLLPGAMDAYRRTRAQYAGGDTSFDPAVKCKPMGFPRVLWDGGPFDIQVQPSLVLFGYTWNRNHRIVDIRSKLPPVQILRYYGISAAQWQNGALVVTSTGYRATTLLDSTGLPHGDDMGLTERYRVADHGKTLKARITIDDPQFYRKPWDVTLTYRRVPGGRIMEDVCEERAPLYKGLFPGNN